jgi:hypothetical protein
MIKKAMSRTMHKNAKIMSDRYYAKICSELSKLPNEQYAEDLHPFFAATATISALANNTVSCFVFWKYHEAGEMQEQVDQDPFDEGIDDGFPVCEFFVCI